MANAVAQRLPAWVLAAIAGWSLVVLICAYAGLGGRYSLHPDDASAVPELPRLDLSRAQNPLQPLTEYAVVGERPLFNPDRRPLPPPEVETTTAEEPSPPAPLEVVLTSVILTSELKLGIVQDKKSNKSQSLRIGDAMQGEQAGWKLVELGPRKAVFEGPSGRNEVELRVFDGTGGQPPTPVGRVETADAAAQQPGVAANAEEAQTPEARAELIRRRIEERRRQMREEAERANQQQQKGG